jgi:8-oxo-dGTP diphosphatase
LLTGSFYLGAIPLRLRNSAKAIIIKNNKLLVTKQQDERGIFYLLPGGGQEAGEKLKECLIRECIEETGYEIEVHDLLFVRECFLDEGIHRVEFIFQSDILSRNQATGMDENQIGIEWLDLDNIRTEPLFPVDLRTLIMSYIPGQQGLYLGEIQ